VAASLSAGFCEECIYRGYLIWAFQSLVGLGGAAALSLLAFAVAHSYQGIKGVLGVAVLGGFFTLVVLISGSLWPAIVLHAVVDICHGLIAWLALRELPGQPATVPAPA
jgi:membrane protease YdiL (CAAX protease family)